MARCHISYLIDISSGKITVILIVISYWNMCNDSIWIVGMSQRFDSNSGSSLQWRQFLAYKLGGKFGSFSFENPSSRNYPKFPFVLPPISKISVSSFYLPLILPENWQVEGTLMLLMRRGGEVASRWERRWTSTLRRLSSVAKRRWSSIWRSIVVLCPLALWWSGARLRRMSESLP